MLSLGTGLVAGGRTCRQLQAGGSTVCQYIAVVVVGILADGTRSHEYSYPSFT